MIWFLKSEVYVGYSIGDFSKARGILAREKIDYTFKVVDQTGQWMNAATMRGNFGSFGSNADYEKLYYVYVKNKDRERAEFLINEALHG